MRLKFRDDTHRCSSQAACCGTEHHGNKTERAKKLPPVLNNLVLQSKLVTCGITPSLNLW